MTWGMIGGAAVSMIGGSLLADDMGAEGANAAAADAAGTQARIGREQWDRYKSTYAPLEDAYVKDAQNADSPQAYEAAASDASATVAEQFGKARDRLTRTPGLDLSSPAAAAGAAGLELAQAATDATQQNAARRKVKDAAWAKKTDALSLGKNLPAQASSALGSAASSNSSLARIGLENATAQAGAAGRVVDRVVTGLGSLNQQQAPAPITASRPTYENTEPQGLW